MTRASRRSWRPCPPRAWSRWPMRGTWSPGMTTTSSRPPFARSSRSSTARSEHPAATRGRTRQTGAVIIGIGIDVVPVERFAESLTRTPGLRDRLFTEAEQQTPSGNERTGESLAARFAAKEALAKALGAPGDLHWHDAEVMVGEHGRPHLEVRGTVAGRAAQLGVSSWHVSLSHDGGIASAVVVAEGLGGGA